MIGSVFYGGFQIYQPDLACASLIDRQESDRGSNATHTNNHAHLRKQISIVKMDTDSNAETLTNTNQEKTTNLFERELPSLLLLSGLSLVVGLTSGVGAWAFRRLIGLIHNLFFLGKLEFGFDANVHTATDTWGIYVILVPMIGAIIVVWLVKTFAPEAKGHGVPEVLDAVYYNDGRIRPMVAIVKSLASAFSIGSGGAVGREGPIIQIGATIGSTLGQWLPLTVRDRVILMAAGASAGIAATFNAPLGGILFSVELLLVSVNSRSILSLTLATATSTYVGRLLMGAAPAFDVPALQFPIFGIEPAFGLISLVPLALACGLLATVFIRSIYWAEDRFESMPGNYYSRHLSGMLCVGIIIYLMQRSTGHFYVEGVGYAAILDILSGTLTDPGFLLLLCGMKLVTTCLTLGSGASGGVFSPALFIGATFGAAYGKVVVTLCPGTEIGITTFAIAAMASMVGASTGAVFTSVVMIAELTGDHNIVLLVVLSVSLSYATRRLISPPSIYSLKLNRRGHTVPEGLSAAITAAHSAGDVMSDRFQVVNKQDGSSKPDPGVVIWNDQNGSVVSVQQQFASRDRPGEPAIAVDATFVMVSPETNQIDVLRLVSESQVELVLVSSDPESKLGDNIVGVITAAELWATTKTVARLS